MIDLPKYNLKIDGKYFVEFQEMKEHKMPKNYQGHRIINLSYIPPKDLIITTGKEDEATIVDGNFNLKSIMEKILSQNISDINKLEIIKK